MKSNLLRRVLLVISAATACTLNVIGQAWDPNQAAGLQGGSGTWDLTSTNWFVSDYSANTTWSAATSSNSAYFNAGSGFVNVAQATSLYEIQLGGLAYGVPGGDYTLSGALLTVGRLDVQRDASVQNPLSVGNIQITTGKTLYLSGGLVTDTSTNYLPWVYGALGYDGTLALTGGYWRSGTQANTYNNAVRQSGGTMGFSGSLVIGSGVRNYSDLGVRYNQVNHGVWTLTSAAAAIEHFSGGNGDIIVGDKGGNGQLDVQAGTVDIERLQIGSGSTSVASYLSSTGVQQSFYSEGLVTVSGTAEVDVAGRIDLVISNAKRGELAISDNAVVRANQISFGTSIGTTNITRDGYLNLNDGALYVGSGGIVNGSIGGVVNDHITLSGGTLGANADWSSSLDMTLNATKTDIRFQAGDESGVAHNMTLSGSLSGTGGVIKTGDGVLTLSGANSYQGETRVQAGRLALSGASNNIASSPSITVWGGAVLDVSGVSDFTLASGQVLRGQGEIWGNLALGSGSVLAPGSSPGTITFRDGLSLLDGSSIYFEFGSLNDLIVVSGGTLSGADSLGGVSFFFTNEGGFAPGTYSLIDGSGATLSGFEASDFAVGQGMDGFDLSFGVVGNVLQLTASYTTSAVPEPSTYAAIVGVGALGLAGWRRRRSRVGADRAQVA